MTEHDLRGDPQQLRDVKEGLIGLWHELPAEHQATMLLVLLREVMSGEYHDWLLDAMARLYGNS